MKDKKTQALIKLANSYYKYSNYKIDKLSRARAITKDIELNKDLLVFIGQTIDNKTKTISEQELVSYNRIMNNKNRPFRYLNYVLKRLGASYKLKLKYSPRKNIVTYSYDYSETKDVSLEDVYRLVALLWDIKDKPRGVMLATILDRKDINLFKLYSLGLVSSTPNKYKTMLIDNKRETRDIMIGGYAKDKGKEIVFNY